MYDVARIRVYVGTGTKKVREMFAQLRVNQSASMPPGKYQEAGQQ